MLRVDKIRENGGPYKSFLNRLFLSGYAPYCYLHIQVQLISLLFFYSLASFLFLHELGIRVNYACLGQKELSILY